MKITCQVELDNITKQLSNAFDYEFTGESFFETPKFKPPEKFNIGLIVGNSGSGKSLLLQEHFNLPRNKRIDVLWNPHRSIASHFSSFKEACEKLFAVGISSVPTMCKPYHVLSNGEQYRAKVSVLLKDNAVIDEFTSVVNRETAYSICVSMNKFIKKNNLSNIVLASCHFDIIEWLQPDWVFNTNSHNFLINEYSLSKFPKLGEITIA